MSVCALPFSSTRPPVFSRDGSRLLFVSDDDAIWSLPIPVATEASSQGLLLLEPRREGDAPSGLLALGWFDGQLATIAVADHHLVIVNGNRDAPTRVPAPEDVGTPVRSLQPFSVWPGEIDPVVQTPVALPLLLTHDRTLYALGPFLDESPRPSPLAEDVVLLAQTTHETIFIGRAVEAPPRRGDAGLYRLGRRYGWRPALAHSLPRPRSALAGFVAGDAVIASLDERGAWRLTDDPRASLGPVPAGCDVVGLVEREATPDLLLLSPDRLRLGCARDLQRDAWSLTTAEPIASVVCCSALPLFAALEGARRLHVGSTLALRPPHA